MIKLTRSVKKILLHNKQMTIADNCKFIEMELQKRDFDPPPFLYDKAKSFKTKPSILHKQICSQISLYEWYVCTMRTNLYMARQMGINGCSESENKSITLLLA